MLSSAIAEQQKASTMVVLDVPHILEVAGGPQALLTMMSQHSPHELPNYPAVQMWRSRNAIPSKWVGLVLYTMVRAGHDFYTLTTDDAELVATVTETEVQA
jgi:hypothetical protein